jgi:outer membrane immunogenic protein
MKQLLVSASVMALLGGAAMAADLPTYEAPAPIYSPAPLAYSWTGFYVGLQAGYGWGDVDGDASVDADPDTGGYDYEIDGFIGGIHAGYNHQFNNFVVGVEGDVEYASLDGSGGGDDPGFGSFYHETELDWLATLRLRAGFAIDRLLIYGTGGVAWAHIDQAFGEDGDPALDDGDRSRWGWTLGAGAEYAFANNWTARAEYRYYDLGDDDVSGVDYSDDNDITLHTVRLGASYKF